MSSLFEGIDGTESIAELYDKIETNCGGNPRTSSEKLWKLRRRTHIGPNNGDLEVMLERSVAMLANRGHMAGWHNQCPIASDIAGFRRNRKSAVDLM